MAPKQHKKKFLTEEDRENLRDVMDHPGFDVIGKVLKEFLKDQEQAVLSMNLSSGEEAKLFLLKARAEGARKLVEDVAAFCSEQNRVAALDA